MRPADGELKVDPAVQERLHRLDPKLFVTWSRYVIDPDSGTPIKQEETERPVHDPHWYLWRHCDDGKVRLVCLAKSFGHEEVRRLEQDLFAPAVRGSARIDEILEVVAHVRERMADKEKASFQQMQRDKIAANRRRIHDLVFDGKGSERDAKPFSAPGLGARSTPGRIIMDPKEDGWELPSGEA